MIKVVLVIHLIIAAAMIAIVLLQKSEGGALGIGGGGGAGGFLTGRGTANLLTPRHRRPCARLLRHQPYSDDPGRRHQPRCKPVRQRTAGIVKRTAVSTGHRRCRRRAESRRPARPTQEGRGAAAGPDGTAEPVNRSFSGQGSQPLPRLAKMHHNGGWCAFAASNRLCLLYSSTPMQRYIFITGGVVSSLGKRSDVGGTWRAATGTRLFRTPAQARPVSQRRSKAP